MASESDIPDLRDRGFMYWRLLSQAKAPMVRWLWESTFRWRVRIVDIGIGCEGRCGVCAGLEVCHSHILSIYIFHVAGEESFFFLNLATAGSHKHSS